MRQHAIEIFNRAIQAVHPSALLPAFIRVESQTLYAGRESFSVKNNSRIYVLSIGKAAWAMAQAMEKILGQRIAKGLVITKFGHAGPLPGFDCYEAGHPVPDEESLKAGEAAVNLLKNLSADDIVLVLISGGASALAVDLPAHATLTELRQVFDLLLASGASIREMNTVRKHLSPNIKGGQLARVAFPATVLGFIISDVVGDRLESIASGPTVPDPSTYQDALDVLTKYTLLKKMPGFISQWLEMGKTGRVPETPKPGDPVFSKTRNFLLGSNRIALEQAAVKARELDYHVVMLTDKLEAEARHAGSTFAKQLLSYEGPRPACLLMGGETTVTIRGKGKGGRNQEFVLAACCEMLKTDPPLFSFPLILAAGTDGTDGPTDAAGAILDANVFELAKAMQLKANDYLQQNDAYHFFERCGGLFITGPTQTNVMDIIIGLLP